MNDVVLAIKKGIIIGSVGMVVFFVVPGPRQAYNYVFGSGVRNPQYLFADSHKEVCRRLRRVVENNKVNIYVENLSTHKLHISLTQRQIRALIVVCTNIAT